MLKNMPPAGVLYSSDGVQRGMPLRFILYSHDSWGLGHLKRSLAIASAITKHHRDGNVLVITGSPCATQFDLPLNCDVLKLPSVSKDAEGRYVSRSLSDDIARIIQLRSRIILESYRSFDPHVVLIDHQLTGLHGEALPMLRHARSTGKKLIYGMRDVLDHPDSVAQEWGRHECYWALRHGYDLICVYGVPEVFDPRREYASLAPFCDKIRFSGYVVPPLDTTVRVPVPALTPHVLVTMGGGQDGRENIETYLDALALQPVHWTSHIIAGPLMETGMVRHFKRRIQRMGLTHQVRVSRFHANLPHLLQAADAVVSMAGYNSCAEILQSRLPAVLLPRTEPRQEQLIRARRLDEMGLARCVANPDPQSLRQAVEEALARPDTLPGGIDLNGVNRVCELISEVGDTRPAADASTVLQTGMGATE